jgi:hypothetical protein
MVAGNRGAEDDSSKTIGVFGRSSRVSEVSFHLHFNDV